MTGEKRGINNVNALYKNIHVWRNRSEQDESGNYSVTLKK